MAPSCAAGLGLRSTWVRFEAAPIQASSGFPWPGYRPPSPPCRQEVGLLVIHGRPLLAIAPTPTTGISLVASAAVSAMGE